MEKILVPTDFSTVSETGSEAALMLAQRGSYGLVYIHLIGVVSDEVQSIEDQDEFHRIILKEVTEKTRKMDLYVEKASENQVNAEKILNYDRSYMSLFDYVRENGISLIVMGSHGVRGPREFLVGSHAQMVSRLSPVPVMVLKEGYLFNSLSHMAFLSEFDQPPMQGYKQAIEIAEKLHMKINLVYINTPGQFSRNRDLYKKMNDYIKGHKGLIDRIDVFNAYNLEDGVEEYARLYHIDIMALVTKHREGTSRVNQNSLTEKLVNHLKVPILSLHD